MTRTRRGGALHPGRPPGAIRTLRSGAAAGLLLAIAAVGCATPGVEVRHGQRLQGASKQYTLEVHGSGWKQVADEESDLSLSSDLGLRIVHVYLHTGETIDSVEDARREKIAEVAQPTLVGSRRSFLAGSDLVPLSLTRYRIGSSWMDRFYFAVATVAVDSGVIEVVGFTGSVDAPADREREMDRLVESFRLTPVASRGGADAAAGSRP